MMNITYSQVVKAEFKVAENRFLSALRRNTFELLEATDLSSFLDRHYLDYSLRCTVYSVGNPQHLLNELRKNIQISTVLPCRISLYEHQSGTMISTVLPSLILNQFHCEMCITVQEIECGILKIIQDTVLEPDGEMEPLSEN